MHEVIASIHENKIGDFQIPSFKMVRGCMVRLWVQKPTICRESILVDELIKLLLIDLKENYSLPIYEYKLKPHKKFRFSLKSYRVCDFILEHNLKSEPALFEKFDLNSNYKIKQLGNHQIKILELLKMFSQHKVCIFDFYGVGPLGENLLTNFINSMLLKGKTILAFDDYNFKSNSDIDNDRLININIKRNCKQ